LDGADRIRPAFTLTGLFALGDDYPMSIGSLEDVYASGIEVAHDQYLLRYAPLKSFSMDAGGGRKMEMPLTRDLVVAWLHPDMQSVADADLALSAHPRVS
jgi:hypothetical protein